MIGEGPGDNMAIMDKLFPAITVALIAWCAPDAGTNGRPKLPDAPPVVVENYVRELAAKLEHFSGYSHVVVVASRSNGVDSVIIGGSVCHEDTLNSIKGAILHSPFFPRAPCPLTWQIKVDRSLPIPGTTFRDDPSPKAK